MRLVKSSFGNALLAEENYFMTNQDSSSITRPNESGRVVGLRNFYGRKLMIIDTPGLNSGNCSNPIIQMEIAHSLERAAPGPHALLFVLEFTPDLICSEEDDKQLIELLIKIFGPGVFQYIVFVFTNLEKLRTDRIEIDRYMKNHLSQAFIDLMLRCQNRHIPINNQAPPNAKDASFAELMLIIDRMLNKNEEKEYTYQSPWYRKSSKLTTNM
jgi:hypothetical protein